MDDILIRLQKVFRRTLRQPQLCLLPEMDAENIQGWNSLTNISLIISLEKEFKIRLNTADIAGTKNISELTGLIAQKIERGSIRTGYSRPMPVERLSTPSVPNLGEVILDAPQFGGKELIVVKLPVPAGQLVEKDDPILDVESSKVAHEIVAPEAGKLVHALAPGDKLPFGKPVALILPPEADAPTVAAIIERLRENKSAVPAEKGEAGPASPASEGQSHLAGEMPTASLSPRKLEEIRVLSRGAGNTMLSVIGARLGRLVIRRDLAESFFADKILDFVAYEAARLMKSFPKLNAAYRNGAIEIHPAINAGIAFDEGERLVVYGLADADRKGLQEIRAEIEDALARYMRRELTSHQLARATFTITDVSALNLDFTFPILPEGQASIIGITRNEEGEFALYLGYDHRVTEGLQAAKFLQELALRVKSFAVRKISAQVPRCSFCEKSAFDETGSWRGRGLLKLLNAKGEEVLACHSCWSGW